MFSQASIYLFRGKRGRYIHHMHQEISHMVGHPLSPASIISVDLPIHPSLPPDLGTHPQPVLTSDLGSYLPLLLTSGGHRWRPAQTCSLGDLPPSVLASTGGHRNTYICQVGGTHPTESCLIMCPREFPRVGLF